MLYGTYRYTFGVNAKRLAGDEEIPGGDVPVGLVLCFHGYRSSALRDGMGAFKLGYNNGYNVLLLVPGADHGMSYALARKQYQEMLYAFVEKYINENEE